MEYFYKEISHQLITKLSPQRPSSRSGIQTTTLLFLVWFTYCDKGWVLSHIITTGQCSFDHCEQTFYGYGQTVSVVHIRSFETYR